MSEVNTPPTPAALTMAQIEELERLASAAKPAPWAPRWTRDEYCRGIEGPDGGTIIGSHDGFPIVNAELACALRNAAPELLAVAREHAQLVSALQFITSKDGPRWPMSIQEIFDHAAMVGWKPDAEVGHG